MSKKELPINVVVCGDSLSILRTFPSKSIDMCMTSPPYWGLRDYGIEQIFGGDLGCEHDFNISHRRRNDKSGGHGNAGYIGAEKSQDGARFGPPTKTCSKCHAWKGQLGLEPTPEVYIEHLTEIFREVKRVLKKEGTFFLNMGDSYTTTSGRQGKGDLYAKQPKVSKKADKSMPIQWRIDLPQKCLCMIPERLAWSLIQYGWILRNKITWIKPNSMPSPVKDRFANKWEYVFYFVKSQRNYFDLDSVREPHVTNAINKLRDKSIESYNQSYPSGYFSKGARAEGHPRGKNPGDIWTINTTPCPVRDVHFATFPEELCRKAIIPGCPEGGIVLDPFAGIGTTGYVARKLGRKFIMIDIKPEFCEKAENKRLAQGVL